ncbi:MAG TPA: FHA domain-containing protein [Sandaracinaceae bacterium LLY-WYZ-13_1]|nr:FHA domain-containing protein [Sandaracinaceae bacterium LLY-WYZ-13_1]
MDVPLYIVVGRSEDCDVVLRDPSVSGRHARLSWRGDKILLEDLGSANGTRVDGRKVRRVEVRPGVEVTLGHATLHWSEPGLKEFLRRGARGDTLIGMRIPGRRFICGSCGARGVMPAGFSKGQLECGSCGVELQVGQRSSSGWATAVGVLVVALSVVGAGFWLWKEGASADSLRRAAERFGLTGEVGEGGPAASPQERSIRRRIAPNVVAAIDPSHPTTRNTAVRLAAEDEGPFRVEQVARIWSHVRQHWRYVNDPRGDEFFSTASVTLSNEVEGDYAGDCDDFAIVLAAMIEAIGGESRIVMLDGEQGGHAYAEACIRAEPEDVARRLSVHYQRNWDRYLGNERLTNIHFRSSPECQVWLNLDWNARVPGGPYGREYWAVAIYPDGRTETLAPSGGPGPEEQAQDRVRASALPGR